LRAIYFNDGDDINDIAIINFSVFVNLQEMNGINADIHVINSIIWPVSLQTLKFGYNFNVDITDIKWPPAIAHIYFGGGFNQNIDNVKWSDTMLSLTFTGEFNQNIDNVKWPNNLLSLAFVDLHADQDMFSIDDVKWPPNLHTFIYDMYAKSIDNILFPDSLQVLNLLHLYLKNFKWPKSLHTFNINLMSDYTSVCWPKSITTFILSDTLNVSFNLTNWPINLHTFTFSRCYNQPLDHVKFPDGIHTISFGHFYNQDLSLVKLPAKLARLIFGKKFNHPLDQIYVPALEEITFGRGYNRLLTNVKWSELLSIIHDYSNKITIKSSNFPKSLYKIIYYSIQQQQQYNQTHTQLIHYERITGQYTKAAKTF
jgi:hypothetical protein